MMYKYLTHTGGSHYKYYEMQQVSEHEWEARYGRIDQSGGQSCRYPMSQWDAKYRQKVRKGYRDVTASQKGYSGVPSPQPERNTRPAEPRPAPATPPPATPPQPLDPDRLKNDPFIF